MNRDDVKTVLAKFLGWDGVIHILRNPHGFTEEVVRQARLDAANYIEADERTREEPREVTATITDPNNSGIKKGNEGPRW